MMRRLLRQAVRLTVRQEGSFTLEASIVVPVLLLAVLALISFSLLLYHRSELYASAAVAADRSASSWDNSSKDLVTGASPVGVSDGLYWRIGRDRLTDVFRFWAPADDTGLTFPADSPEASDTLPLKKLRKTADQMPDYATGRVEYTNHVFLRVVQVDLSRQARIPKPVGTWFDSQLTAEAESAVVEPVELLRSVDLARTFVERLKGLLRERDPALPQPSAVPIEQTEELGNRLTSEKEAAEYLRHLLGTPGAVFVTTPSGLQRKLDSLDPDGLFHEAKFGYIAKTDAVEAQIAKDLELLQSAGQVKGVVWHFFRDSRNGKLGPSKPLRRELEKRGIVVVIHS